MVCAQCVWQSASRGVCQLIVSVASGMAIVQTVAGCSIVLKSRLDAHLAWSGSIIWSPHRYMEGGSSCLGGKLVLGSGGSSQQHGWSVIEIRP
jgi:hypothetical protein